MASATVFASTYTVPAILSRAVARISETLLPASTLSRIRAKREWGRWVESLRAGLRGVGGGGRRHETPLFKDGVRLVEIETHAKC